MICVFSCRRRQTRCALVTGVQPCAWRSRRIVLAGHTDTVPPNGNEVARIEGDVLWGLGASDMKGGLAVMLALAESVPEPAIDVTYVFYATEEVASEHNGLGHLARDRPDLDRKSTRLNSSH